MKEESQNNISEPFGKYNANGWAPYIPVQDDGLIIGRKEVGSWSEKKYNLVGRYCEIFTKSMHKKWGNLVYIDLFAGSGYAKFKESKVIVRSSPLIALSLPTPFSKYIFCEKDADLCNALRERVKRDFPDKNVTIIEGDCNEQIDKIIKCIPQYSKGNTVLSFSFIDPFSLNLSFKTVEKLGRFAMDFLILLALGMDANRNMEVYLKESNEKIATFLNEKDWREKFLEKFTPEHKSFVQFIASEYRNQIERIGYKNAEHFHEIRSADKNLPLYHLAFFSKHNLGNDFWKKVQDYSDGQGTLKF